MTTNSKLPRAKDTPPFDYEGLSPREKESFKVYHMKAMGTGKHPS